MPFAGKFAVMGGVRPCGGVWRPGGTTRRGGEPFLDGGDAVPDDAGDGVRSCRGLVRGDRRFGGAQ